jgi:hypothetical protein
MEVSQIQSGEDVLNLLNNQKEQISYSIISRLFKKIFVPCSANLKTPWVLSYGYSR